MGFLLLWLIGAAGALIYFAVCRPLIRMISHRPVQYVLATIMMVGMWFVTVAATMLFIEGANRHFSNPWVGVTGVIYWGTLLPLLFGARRKEGRRLSSRINVEPPRFHSGSKAEPSHLAQPAAARANDRGFKERHPLDVESPFSKVISALEARALLLVGIGIVIGGLAVHYAEKLKPYSSFEECFLAESKGRQEAAFRVVTIYCRGFFPR